MNDILHDLAKRVSDTKEQAIKETALAGYDYMIYKSDVRIVGNDIHHNVIYKGLHSEEDAMSHSEQGFDVLELRRVREYLNNIKGRCY